MSNKTNKNIHPNEPDLDVLEAMLVNDKLTKGQKKALESQIKRRKDILAIDAN